MRTTMTALATACAICACADDESVVVELGTIALYDTPPMIQVPRNAVVGQEFRFTVVTFGGACVSFEGTEVVQDDVVVDITPFDRRHIPSTGEVCADVLASIIHEGALTFSSTGEKVVRVHGKRLHSAGIDEVVVTLAVRVE